MIVFLNITIVFIIVYISVKFYLTSNINFGGGFGETKSPCTLIES